MTETLELSRDDCEARLRASRTARVAFSTPNGPQIIPVNYSVVDDAIILRTSPYSLLGTFARDSVVAIEVDELDHDERRGWSVVARGRASFVTDPAEIEHIREVSQPEPWASGTRNLHLRVRWNELSGRRIGPVPLSAR